MDPQPVGPDLRPPRRSYLAHRRLGGRRATLTLTLTLTLGLNPNPNTLPLPYPYPWQVDGVPRLGWEDTLAYLTIPVILVCTQTLSLQLLGSFDAIDDGKEVALPLTLTLTLTPNPSPLTPHA